MGRPTFLRAHGGRSTGQTSLKTIRRSYFIAVFNNVQLRERESNARRVLSRDRRAFVSARRDFATPSPRAVGEIRSRPPRLAAALSCTPADAAQWARAAGVKSVAVTRASTRNRLYLDDISDLDRLAYRSLGRRDRDGSSRVISLIGRLSSKP